VRPVTQAAARHDGGKVPSDGTAAGLALASQYAGVKCKFTTDELRTN